VVYDLAFDLGWRKSPPVLTEWIEGYVGARYGRADPKALSAWRHLSRSVYAQHDPSPAMESPITAPPGLDLTKATPWGSFERDYDAGEVWTAWDELQSASRELGSVDPYRYDLVDVARQALADLSLPVYGNLVAAYRSGDAARFGVAKARFTELMDDLDTLLGTRREFLLGAWLADARRWGITEAERELYERNARLLVTLWGPPGRDAYLHDYACRQWSGLIKGFYSERWRRFFAFLETQPAGYSEDRLFRVMGRPGDESNEFYKGLSTWEYAWCDGHEHHPPKPEGDSVAVSRRLYGKWKPLMLETYPGYAWSKPKAPEHP